MLKFNSVFKLYLIKNTNKVKLAIKVSDNLVNEFFFNQEQFDQIMNGWENNKGIEIKVDSINWNFMLKKSSPRPVNQPTSYVKISAYINGMGLHFRVSYDDMIVLKKDYFYQKNHKMYWDTDV
jgi:hypothetical protein